MKHEHIKTEITPADTRYVPLQQQPYCCVPTCIQMIMLRHHIPLRPAEEIGAHMGLIVPPEDAVFFYNPAISETRPTNGYGSAHLVNEATHPNHAFISLGIPLHMHEERINNFADTESFKHRIKEIISQDLDALICLRWADLIDKSTLIEPVDMLSGHVIVIDQFTSDNTLRVMDPARGAKWREFSIDALYRATHAHTAEKGAGLWIFQKK